MGTEQSKPHLLKNCLEKKMQIKPFQANENPPAIENKNKAKEYNTTVTSESNTVKQVFGKLYLLIHPYV